MDTRSAQVLALALNEPHAFLPSDLNPEREMRGQHCDDLLLI